MYFLFCRGLQKEKLQALLRKNYSVLKKSFQTRLWERGEGKNVGLHQKTNDTITLTVLFQFSEKYKISCYVEICYIQVKMDFKIH